MALLLGSLGMAGMDDPGFLPDERLTPPGGPEIAIFRSGPPGLISLRLSFPLTETLAEAGGGQILALMAHDRMSTIASRIGARVEVHRTPQAMVYHVSGASSDLDFLVWALSEGLAPPSVTGFDAARRTVLAEVERRLETPQGVLALRLRQALVPEEAAVGGTPASLERISPGHIAALRVRSHTLEAARLIVVGDVSTAHLLASLTDLQIPIEGPVPQLPPPSPSGLSLGDPELIRHWLAVAWPIEGQHAADLVLARLAADALRERTGDYETGVELWNLEGGRALVISGAAYPRTQSAMRSRIQGILTEIEGRITEPAVMRAAQELRTELLFAGRSSAGLAELVGQAWDSGAPPEGVDRLLGALAILGEAEVRMAFSTLSSRTPLRQELRP